MTDKDAAEQFFHITREFILLNATVNANLLGCPGCMAFELSMNLATYYAVVHNKSPDESEEDFIERTSRNFANLLKETLHEAKNLTTADSVPTHAGTSTTQ